jgi:transcription elongation factor Elf1
MEDIEKKIRELMRLFPVECRYCGSQNVVIDREEDTDTGVMDELYCPDCGEYFYMISSVDTQFVRSFREVN